MRPSLILGITALLAAVSLGTPAKADGSNFDVAASKGAVTVTPHAGWHINLDYSWALKKGDDKVKAKGDFSLAKEKASVTGVAAGSYTLKGAVCSDSNCAPFTTQVTVQ
ncbi:MAG TPA: hypothetical protein VF765_19585 [Polyangiaceae bacterium]